MLTTQAHIAGIGISDEPDTTPDGLALSAGTKALLDAGITYRDVDTNVAGFWDKRLRVTRSCFSTFGPKERHVYEVDIHSALIRAIRCIESEQKNCVCLVGVEKVGDRRMSSYGYQS